MRRGWGGIILGRVARLLEVAICRQQMFLMFDPGGEKSPDRTPRMSSGRAVNPTTPNIGNRYWQAGEN